MPTHLVIDAEKQLVLQKQFNQWKETGQEERIEKMMEKRRKKNSTKDHRKLPKRRATETAR